MAMIDINQHQIYYEKDGSGETLIFLHNGFYSSEYWRETITALSQKYMVIMYDRLGYGQSEKISAMSGDIIQHGVNELETFVNTLQLKQFYLCGHCLGGAIALLYSLLHPDRVKKVIAESVGYYSSDLLLTKTDWTFQPFDQIDSEMKGNLIKMHGKEYAPVLWGLLREYKDAYIMNKDYTILDKIKNIKLPVLLINGDNDFYFEVEHTVKAFRAFKNAYLWILPGVGHNPHLEQTKAFVYNVSNFITR